MSEAAPIPVQVILDGSSSGIYTWDGDHINVTEGVPDNLEVTVVVAGQAMASETRVANVLPLGTADAVTYTYACEGNALQILPPDPTSLPIKLRRTEG